MVRVSRSKAKNNREPAKPAPVPAIPTQTSEPARRRGVVTSHSGWTKPYIRIFTDSIYIPLHIYTRPYTGLHGNT